MGELLLIIRDLVYLVIVGIWVGLFFFNRQMANDSLPLLIVLSFLNINSRISDIIKRLNEFKK
jgi:hypothetical protein